MTDKQNVRFEDEAYTLIRKPLDPGTGQPLEKCGYALFPGTALAQSEPELVILMYDSILHQHPDTAMFLYKGREGADPLLNRKWSERLLTRWRNLGKPTMIITTPEDMKFFRGILTEIPTVSLYDELLDHGISGGCNREIYRLLEPEQYGFEPAVRELADTMGAVLYDPKAAEASRTNQTDAKSGDANAAGAGEAVDIAAAFSDAYAEESKASGCGAYAAIPLKVDPEDIPKIPFLTSSIDLRNTMKKRGFEAAHILELVYGMGRSNQHLAHGHGDGEHGDAHGHDHEHDHHAPPQVREYHLTAEEESALDDLFSPEAQKRNLQDVHDTLLAMFWNE